MPPLSEHVDQSGQQQAYPETIPVATDDQRDDLSSASLSELRGIGDLSHERGDRGRLDDAADSWFRLDAEHLGLTLDEYKRKFGLLVKDGTGTWQGSFSDPFGRRVQIDREEYPRVISGDFIDNLGSDE